MLALLLALALSGAPKQDMLTSELIALCERPSDECYAYFRGFLDSLLAHEWAMRELSRRDSRIVQPKLVCVPPGLDIERVRVSVLKAWKDKPPSDQGPSWALTTIGRLYPCK
jgi:hypothetical protein